MKDYYKILGVREDAFEEEIRDRWLDLVKDHHPDLVTDGTMDERIKEINEAYQVLKNPSARLEYDFQRTSQQKARRPAWRRWVSVSCSLALLGFLGVIYFLEAEDFVGWKPMSRVSTSVKGTIAPSPRIERTREPEEKGTGQPADIAHIGEVPPGASVATDMPKEKAGDEKKTVAVIEADPPEPPSPAGKTAVASVVRQKRKAEQPLRRPGGEKPRTIGTPRVVQVKEVSSAPLSAPVVKAPPVEASVRKEVSRPLVAGEEEVKAFFAKYVKAYEEKNIETFLTLFSPKATHNEKGNYHDIQRIYTRFFVQSEALDYQVDDLKIEIYENGVEAKARYAVDQVLKRGGVKKAWKGAIRWSLIRENGSLKIIGIHYEQQESL